jgi:hypothetical protein
MMWGVVAGVVATAAVPSLASMGILFQNDYSDAAQASNYAADRNNPGGFTVNASGDGVLKLSVLSADLPGFDSSFYNFHGIQTGPAGDFSGLPGAIATVDVYVPSDWNGASKRAGDLWIKLDDGTGSAWPSIGVYNYGDGNGALVSMFSPYGGFSGSSFYDRTDLTINYDAFNTLGMRFNGESVDFLFNGTVVGTDSSTEYDPSQFLQTAFLQGWQSDSDYTVTFDNLVVAVPEPATLGLLGLAGLTLGRRRIATR